MPSPRPIRKLALINFGGIGDEILFSPVIAELRRYLPDTHITLFLEDRSQAIQGLLPGVDAYVPLRIQGQSRQKLFWTLVTALRGQGFDAVISSGSSPFIPLMLWASGIPLRAGFQTGWTSRRLLSAEAPLDRQAYAADMYFTLATSFLHHQLGSSYQAPVRALPTLNPPSEADAAWAREILSRADGLKAILIHPGVSLVSIRKNILKGWPAGHWVELIRELSAEHHVFLAGGPDDAETIGQIRALLPEGLPHFSDLYGQTRSFAQLAALVAGVDVLVCVDSSPMHIGVGYGKPVVAMFGPTDEKKLLPAGPLFKAVTRHDLPCRPCLWDVRQVNCETSDCLTVTVSALRAAVDNILKVPV